LKSDTKGDRHYVFFFFSSRRRHTRSKRDWSSDVCSSDLTAGTEALRALRALLNRVPERYYNMLFDESTVRSAEEAKQRLVAAGYTAENGFRDLRAGMHPVEPVTPPDAPGPRAPAEP